MTPVALSELTGHLAEVAPGLTEQAGQLFRDNGFAKVGFLAPSSVTGAVRREAELLVTAHGARRDLRFAETGHTARRMRNVRRREIHQHRRVIPALYGQAVLRHALEPIVGEEVLPCPYEPEQYVITELTAQGDTHGWHWDDYSFALVWVLESPPAEDGGFVQFVPNTVVGQDQPSTAPPVHRPPDPLRGTGGRGLVPDAHRHHPAPRLSTGFRASPVLQPLAAHHEVAVAITHRQDFAGLGDNDVAPLAEWLGLPMLLARNVGEPHVVDTLGDIGPDVLVSETGARRCPRTFRGSRPTTRSTSTTRCCRTTPGSGR
jgi:hypothetical protein